ncbi:unnamed protein product [Calicophoron daubneyi]|uniref:PRELI/MSF1 domain-containing protein n=1 Tax=Calicophoron daubneyi TaxID=300641 RepID=A0AAV2TRB1_CALDB
MFGRQGWKEECVIKYPWDVVMRSVQTKYPNPYNNNVLSIDILGRSVDKLSGAMHSLRLPNATYPMIPRLGQIRALEWSSINSMEKRMVAISHNMDLRGVFKAVEHMEYTVHPENPNWTLLKHTVSVDGLPLIALTASSKSKQAAHQGRIALQWVISNRLPNLGSYANWTLDSKLAVPNPAKQKTQLNESFTLSPSAITDSQAPTPNFAGSSTGDGSLSIQSTSIKQENKVDPGIEQSVALKKLPFFADRPSFSIVTAECPQERPCLASLGSHFDTLSRDVSAMGDALIRRCQRASRLFSGVDEYVVIM